MEFRVLVLEPMALRKKKKERNYQFNKQKDSKSKMCSRVTWVAHSV